MACEEEWDAYLTATANRIAAEILRDAAAANLADAQAAEWTACMAWWYCGEQGMRVSGDVDTSTVPSLERATIGQQESKFAAQSARLRVERLKLEYQRVTGKPYEGK